MKTKYVIFFLIISILTLINISCPTELIKGTVWEGALKLADEIDIEATFYTNNVVHLYIKSKDVDAGKFTTGSYSLNNETNTFTAKLDAKVHMDTDIPTNILDTYKIKLEGELNFYNGVGSGDCEIDELKTTDPDKHYEGEWELQKVK